MKKIAVLSLLLLFISSLAFSQAQVVHFKKLQEFLPQEVKGFERGKPTGSTNTMMGMTTSEASLEFTHPEKEWSISLSIIDFTAMPYMGAAMMYQNMDFESETETGYEKTVQLKNGYRGYERAETGEYPSCELQIIVGGKFALQIDGSGFSDAEILHDIAENMDLKKLEETKAE